MQAAGTVFNTADDGCCDTRNMYSSFAVNKYLRTVASVGFLFTFSVSLKLFTITASNLTVKPNFLKPSGHYMYHQFNVHKLYVLPTQCIYVFCVDLRTNNDYFPIRH